MMADGYGAYSGLQNRGAKFALAHCWAHARRKFVETEEFFPVEARQAIDLIGELYDVERLCPTGPPGDPMRRELRDTRSREILGRIQQWALSVRTLPKGGLGKAIAYMSGLWPGLTRFLDDPRIPLDNNATERALRGVVIGRKNHYGSRSRRGTEVAALFYSLCETAKLNKLDPASYLSQIARAAIRAEALPLPHEMLAQQIPVAA
jgi:transposase